MSKLYSLLAVIVFICSFAGAQTIFQFTEVPNRKCQGEEGCFVHGERVKSSGRIGEYVRDDVAVLLLKPAQDFAPTEVIGTSKNNSELEVSVVSQPQLDELFRELNNNQTALGAPCFTFTKNSSMFLYSKGIKVGKVIFYANIDGTPRQPNVSWWRHIAPFVVLKDSDGTKKKIVLDPQNFSEPLEMQAWERSLSKGDIARKINLGTESKEFLPYWDYDGK